MHLIGFTIEIYHDARPYERQIPVPVAAVLYKKLIFLTVTQLAEGTTVKITV